MAEPQITVSILSWLLEERLIKTLKSLPKSTSLPLNLCLHVQGEEQISQRTKQLILDATSGFFQRDVFFTPHNQGAATPRAKLTKRSAITPYIFITDNDMEFQPGSIDTLYEFLKNNPSYGMVDLAHNYLKWHRRVHGTEVECTPADFSQRVVDVDLIGAASILMRKEVALLPNLIDTRYFIGTWDFDMCLNVRSQGWRIATICDKSLIAINNKTSRTNEYRAKKVFHPIRLKGLKLFEHKWGFSSETYPYQPTKPKRQPSDTSIITRAVFTHCSSTAEIGALTPKRLDLMQSNMINSLKSQTDQDFDLYIICGPQHCEATKLIESLDYQPLNVHFIYNETDLSDWKQSSGNSRNWGRENDRGCPEDLARSCHPFTTIMARIDIDDWVAPGWVMSMKHLASTIPDKSFIINYQVISQGPDGRLYKFFAPHTKNRTSPFLALVQKTEHKISPYHDTHLNMGKLFECCVTVPPSYCFMVIHGENRSNRLYKNDKSFESLATINKQPKLIKLNKQVKLNNSWRQRIAAQQSVQKFNQLIGDQR